jgi:hypothetical protein
VVTKTKEVGVRLSVKDKETVERALKELGRDGAAALKQIQRAAEPVSGSLLAMNTSVNAAKAAWGGFWRGAVTALIPTVSFVAALNGAKDALREFGQIADDAKSSGLDVELFQSLTYQAKLAGVEFGELSVALDAFNKNSGLAAVNKGRMVTQLRELNPELLKNIQLAGSQEERLRLVADAIDKEADANRKAAIAAAAFGDAGTRMVQVFEGGAEAIDRTLVKARDLGLVVDRELIARADELGDEFDTAARIIDLKFKQALVDLAPFLISIAELAGGLADVLRTLREAGRPMADQSTGYLEERLQTLLRIKEKAEQGLIFSKTQWERGAGSSTGLSLPQELAAIEAELDRRRTNDITVGGGGGGGGGSLPLDDDGKRALREAQRLMEQLRDASEVYAAAVLDLDKKLAAGLITQEIRNRGVAEAALKFAKAADDSAEYAEAEGRLRQALEAGILTQEKYAKALEDLTKRRLEAENTVLAGLQLGLMRIAESADTVGKDIGDGLVRGVERFEDAWMKALETGEFKWQDLVKQMLLDIARMSTRQLITGPIASLLSGVLGGLGGGGFGAIGSRPFNMAGNFSIGGAASYDGGGFTGYGPRSGGVDGRGGFPAILHPNETVIDHARGGRQGGGVSVALYQTNYIQGLTEAQALAAMAENGRQLLALVPDAVRKAQRDGVFG